MTGDEDEGDDIPLTVTMTLGEWTALAEVLERALSVVLMQEESPLKRQNVKGLVDCLIHLHDDGVYVEAIDEAGTALYEEVAEAIQTADAPE